MKRFGFQTPEIRKLTDHNQGSFVKTNYSLFFTKKAIAFCLYLRYDASII